MTDDEAWAFLGSTPPHTGKLATTRRDGAPHVAPIWFAVDGRTIVFTTGAGTLKGRTICRDPRVALCVDDEQPPFSFVVVEGTAEVSEDPDDLLRWATVLGRRYMGPDRAEAFGRRNAVAGELLVRVRPTRISSARDVAMWEPLEHVPIPTATVGRQGAQRRGR
jgi:PPOX class probable F420-dependent enzyme